MKEDYNKISNLKFRDRITGKDVDNLVELHKRHGINIAGEGGEFESLVLNCPLFRKRIKILKADIIEENKNTARYVVEKAVLE